MILLVVALHLSSPALKPAAAIPAEFTCDGANVSPPLAWGEAPAGTKSWALIADDPDAPGGTWVHWVLYNLPPETRSLPQGASLAAGLPQGAIEGINDFRKPGYGGPCPPSGTHRYYFRLYALDTTLALPRSASRQELDQAMKGHLLAQAELMATYQRPRG